MILFAGMVVYVTVLLGQDDRRKNDLKIARLQSEKLLSEKLQVVKQYESLQADFKHLEQKHFRVTDELDQTEDLLAYAERELLQVRSAMSFKTIRRQGDQITFLINKERSDSIRYMNEIIFLTARLAETDNELFICQNDNKIYQREIKRLARLQLNELSASAYNKHNVVTTNAKDARMIRVQLQVPDLSQHFFLRS